MNFSIFFQYYALFLLMLAAGFFCPLLYETIKFGAPSVAFLGPCLVAALLGFMVLRKRRKLMMLDHQTALFLVSVSWLTASLAGSLPYYLSGAIPYWPDAFFESTSGFTGTGASIVPDPAALGGALLLWRSLSQWIGGLGIIMFFLALSPVLGFSGGQLLAETGSQGGSITPRTREVARNMWLLYVLFTGLLGVCLVLAGMPGFDAINHALATIATGGFSTRADGIAAFSPGIQLIIAIFMLIGAMNFGIHYRLFMLRDKGALGSTEFKWFIGLTIFFTALMFSSLYGHRYNDPYDALHHAFFAVASSISSTGFPYKDLSLWSPLSHVLIITLVVMGGMSGSTAGGVKVIRLVVALKQLMKHFTQVVHPSALVSIRANDQSIPLQVIDGIWAVLFMYFLCFSVTCGVLAADGLDIVSAASSAFSALSNFGPALGSLAPAQGYSQLAVESKMVLSAAMLLGRLEFFAVLVIFTRAYWRA